MRNDKNSIIKDISDWNIWNTSLERIGSKNNSWIQILEVVVGNNSITRTNTMSFNSSIRLRIKKINTIDFNYSIK